MKLTSYDKERLAAVKEIIDKDYSLHHSIQTLAENAGINAAKLKQGFKEIYGSAIYEYLKERRLQYTLVLLKEGNHNIKQVALLAGFKHARNFNTAFKVRFGYTPGSQLNQ